MTITAIALIVVGIVLLGAWNILTAKTPEERRVEGRASRPLFRRLHGLHPYD